MKSHPPHAHPRCHPSSTQMLVQDQRRPAQPLQNQKRHTSLSCCTVLLLLHTDPAHRCLTFSDILSARCLAPPGLCAAPAKKQSKQLMLRYCTKPKPTCINSNLLLLYLGCSPTRPCHLQVPWLPWAEQLQDKHTHRHRPTLHMPPLTMGFKEDRKLSARTMTPRWEKLSDKETYRTATAPSEEAPRQPQKNRVEQNRLLQEVTLKTETMDVQNARLQDLRI